MMLALGDGQGSGVVSATTEPVTDDWGTFNGTVVFYGSAAF
jgi:hypothetical protein